MPRNNNISLSVCLSVCEEVNSSFIIRSCDDRGVQAHPPCAIPSRYILQSVVSTVRGQKADDIFSIPHRNRRGESGERERVNNLSSYSSSFFFPCFTNATPNGSVNGGIVDMVFVVRCLMEESSKSRLRMGRAESSIGR